MGSHSYLQNLCSGSACDQMHHLQELNLRGILRHERHLPGVPKHGMRLPLEEMYIKGEDATATAETTNTDWWLVKQADGTWVIVNEPVLSATQQAEENINIAPMPAPTSERPWTQESWNEWNLLENNGTEHPDRVDRKSTRLNSSHSQQSRMPSSA